jgi:hypothetical protein
MRSFKGLSSNIFQPIIGKIVSDAASVPGSENDSFLFVFNDYNSGKLHSGIILGRNAAMEDGVEGPQFRLLETDTPIAVGDILLLEPSGAGTMLYEKNSYSNTIMLTEQCNCRCTICPQPPRNDQEDLVDLSLRVVSLMDPDTEVLGITGGEPTLVWEGLMEVIGACGRLLPNTALHLLTNARVLKDFYKAKELTETTKNDLLVCVPLYADV